jgi:hypothetical protein
MGSTPAHSSYESWYLSAAGQEQARSSYFQAAESNFNRNRDIAAEAYKCAVQRLKAEVGVSLNAHVPIDNKASLQDVQNVVEVAKRKYEDASKEHTGTRKVLENLSVRVLHYSRIFDTLGQHHAEYVALAWGAVKIVLVVC